jgi:hypothetical protein
VLEIQFSSRAEGEPSGLSEVNSKLDGFGSNELGSASPQAASDEEEERKTRTLTTTETSEREGRRSRQTILRSILVVRSTGREVKNIRARRER